MLGNDSQIRATTHETTGSMPPRDGSLTISRVTARASHGVRQPVSCEPCRKRKIRCSRTTAPCDTCKRRGLADRCLYVGNDSPSNRNSLYTQPPSASPPHSNEELLARVTNLENLLQRNTQQLLFANDIPDPASHLLSPYSDSSKPTNRSYPTTHRAPRCLGTLTTSASGYVKYEPRSSQWTSILANTGILPGVPSLSDPDDSCEGNGCFPFAGASSPTMEELLATLPPMQHCTQLKDLYFKVFSPVCL
jgi:hypothetical protein